MDVSQYIPQNPEDGDWDVVVIGTGMGGSTLGYALAKKGRRVLFLEKGKFLHHGPLDAPEWPQGPMSNEDQRLFTGWWPQRLEGTTSFGKADFYAPLGCGSGGTTGHYGAQLERFSALDFSPKESFRNVEGTNLPEHWPVSHETMTPYYEQAESLFRICGSQDPLKPDEAINLRTPPALGERDQALHDSFTDLGLHPYRAHVGYEYLPECFECTEICPKRCKKEAGEVCLMPALSDYGAQILPECEVEELISEKGRVSAVRATRNGKEIVIRAGTVVLAAGAYMTPRLLLKSASAECPDGLANSSGMVGRNLMLHTSDFIALDTPQWLSPEGPRKTLALNDFYVDNGHKLGTFQTVGFPFESPFILAYLRHVADSDPRWWRKMTNPMLPLASRYAPRMFAKSTMFATIVEDLPYSHNRVILDSNAQNGIRFEYEYTKELKWRNAYFRKRIKDTLSPKHRVRFLSGRNNINYGHVCGTCKSGDDPATSVLDSTNRAHDLDNLYVVDASFFPSSGGTNPSLTIAANALRVAEHI
jgi:choline dehydrogenase-like flavoprotein